MDTFLDNENFYQRLLTNYKEYGKIIVCFDFDDTVRPLRGTSCSMVIELIKNLKPYAHLICYTARSGDELIMVKDYLIENDIPFDYINKEYDGSEINGNKIYYNAFLDNSAGLRSCYDVLLRFLNEVRKGE